MYDIIQTKLTVLANLLESHMWETIPCAKNETAQETTDLVTFTEEILNGKLHFLCSVMNCWIKMILCKIFKSSHQRCSVRKDILSDFAKFKGKHLCQSLRPAAEACNFIIKETGTSVFLREFCEISKNAFFTEHLWATASGCFTLRRISTKSMTPEIRQDQHHRSTFIFGRLY